MHSTEGDDLAQLVCERWFLVSELLRLTNSIDERLIRSARILGAAVCTSVHSKCNQQEDLMQFPPLEVLYEDNHVLAVSKPARLATMGVPAGEPSLLTVAKAWIKQRYSKPGNVYLGVVSRLDAPVTGVVLLARTSKAANRLTQQFRSREVEKVYWAITEAKVDPPQGRLVHWLKAHGRHRRMMIVGPTIEGAKEAILSYRRFRTLGANSLLEVSLETGRKHQIRIQLADHGHAILGDRKYGAHVTFPLGIALHARRVTFQHPVRDERITIEAPVPQVWAGYGVSD